MLRDFPSLCRWPRKVKKNPQTTSEISASDQDFSSLQTYGLKKERERHKNAKRGKTNFRLGKGEDNLVEMRQRRGRRFLFPQQTNGSPWTCTLVVPAHYPSRIQQRRAFSGATSSVSGLQSARVSSERDSLRWPTHRRPKWPIDSHSTANDTRFWGFLAEHGRRRRKQRNSVSADAKGKTLELSPARDPTFSSSTHLFTAARHLFTSFSAKHLFSLSLLYSFTLSRVSSLVYQLF